jgi:hypothetical protein
MSSTASSSRAPGATAATNMGSMRTMALTIDRDGGGVLDAHRRPVESRLFSYCQLSVPQGAGFGIGARCGPCRMASRRQLIGDDWGRGRVLVARWACQLPLYLLENAHRVKHLSTRLCLSIDWALAGGCSQKGTRPDVKHGPDRCSFAPFGHSAHDH